MSPSQMNARWLCLLNVSEILMRHNIGGTDCTETWWVWISTCNSVKLETISGLVKWKETPISWNPWEKREYAKANTDGKEKLFQTQEWLLCLLQVWPCLSAVSAYAQVAHRRASLVFLRLWRGYCAAPSPYSSQQSGLLWSAWMCCRSESNSTVRDQDDAWFGAPIAALLAVLQGSFRPLPTIPGIS